MSSRMSSISPVKWISSAFVAVSSSSNSAFRPAMDPLTFACSGASTIRSPSRFRSALPFEFPSIEHASPESMLGWPSSLGAILTLAPGPAVWDSSVAPDDWDDPCFVFSPDTPPDDWRERIDGQPDFFSWPAGLDQTEWGGTPAMLSRSMFRRDAKRKKMIATGPDTTSNHLTTSKPAGEPLGGEGCTIQMAMRPASMRSSWPASTKKVTFASEYSLSMCRDL
mmetsp:Transcript_34310/g.110777  ORF Transcript_34310/g.110777 Transcript_34310/m.110777 type:complete len:223 (+) Transcript_34310:476-1144(+)